MTALTWDPCPNCKERGWLWHGYAWRECGLCYGSGAKGMLVKDELGRWNGEVMYPGTRKPMPPALVLVKGGA